MNVGETFIQITAEMAVSHLRFFSIYISIMSITSVFLNRINGIRIARMPLIRFLILTQTLLFLCFGIVPAGKKKCLAVVMEIEYTHRVQTDYGVFG